MARRASGIPAHSPRALGLARPPDRGAGERAVRCAKACRAGAGCVRVGHHHRSSPPAAAAATAAAAAALTLVFCSPFAAMAGAKPVTPGYRSTALEALRGADLSGKVAVITGEVVAPHSGASGQLGIRGRGNKAPTPLSTTGTLPPLQAATAGWAQRPSAPWPRLGRTACCAAATKRRGRRWRRSCSRRSRCGGRQHQHPCWAGAAACQLVVAVTKQHLLSRGSRRMPVSPRRQARPCPVGIPPCLQGKISVAWLDLADLASVQAAGRQLAASLPRLDLLVLNAGVRRLGLVLQLGCCAGRQRLLVATVPARGELGPAGQAAAPSGAKTC